VHLKKRFNIKVLGQEFSVLSDTGDEHVANIVQYVNGKAEEIGRASKNATTFNVAILVALNIADEFFRFKGEKESIIDELESESSRLIRLIEGRN
jgi:cell division protein ZapA